MPKLSGSEIMLRKEIVSRKARPGLGVKLGIPLWSE